jgi:hypothetical protein
MGGFRLSHGLSCLASLEPNARLRLKAKRNSGDKLEVARSPVGLNTDTPSFNTAACSVNRPFLL